MFTMLSNLPSSIKYILFGGIAVTIMFIIYKLFGGRSSGEQGSVSKAVDDVADATGNIVKLVDLPVKTILAVANSIESGVSAITSSKPITCPTGSSSYLGKCWTCPEGREFAGGKCPVKIPAGSIGTDRPNIGTWDRHQVYSSVGLDGAYRACPGGSVEAAGSCYSVPAGYTYISPGIARLTGGAWYQSKSIGMVPRSGCISGKSLMGALCYPTCPDGYTRDPGNVEYCTSNCPVGTTTKGPYVCDKNAIPPTSLGTLKDVGECPTGYWKGDGGLLCFNK